MIRTNHHRTLKRAALSLVLGACLAQGAAWAQSTSGDIVGSAPAAAGERVQIRSLASGITREVAVGTDGRFRVSSLPTGSYEVSLDGGATRTVTVVAGQAAAVNLDGDAQNLDTIVVHGSGVNAIDLSSVESRTTFTAEQLNTLPVSRDVTSVSLLTPGTVSSSGYFGPASFGGASAAENSYYVDGFNVTNLYDSLSFSQVPYQAIGQLDVQTGGYGAKYGFSTGGVTSVNVKRGTNEWHGGFSWAATPDSLSDNVGKLPRFMCRDDVSARALHGEMSWTVAMFVEHGDCRPWHGQQWRLDDTAGSVIPAMPACPRGPGVWQRRFQRV